jgi:hypothetical protein
MQAWFLYYSKVPYARLRSKIVSLMDIGFVYKGMDEYLVKEAIE